MIFWFKLLEWSAIVCRKKKHVPGLKTHVVYVKNVDFLTGRDFAVSICDAMINGWVEKGAHKEREMKKKKWMETKISGT